jgi:hypothetical protein
MSYDDQYNNHIYYILYIIYYIYISITIYDNHCTTTVALWLAVALYLGQFGGFA